MNRKYIDFVPTKNKTSVPKRGQEAPRVAHVEMPKQSVVRRTSVKPARTASRRVAPMAKKPVAPKMIQGNAVVKKAPVASRTTVSKNQVLALGVVEDLSSKPVIATAPKKPLDHGPVASAVEAKAQKVKASKSLRPTTVEKPVEKPVDNKGTYKTPKSPFINQSKIEKRPLSKNVYQKKIAVPKEEPKGPVTIITKPEKDSRVGIIITIIMTIILGATAGTIAFLLLPK